MKVEEKLYDQIEMPDPKKKCKYCSSPLLVRTVNDELVCLLCNHIQK